MESVHNILNTKYGIRLLAPSYVDNYFNGALMHIFNPSTKENGGIFSQPQQNHICRLGRSPCLAYWAKRASTDRRHAANTGIRVVAEPPRTRAWAGLGGRRNAGPSCRDEGLGIPDCRHVIGQTDRNRRTRGSKSARDGRHSHGSAHTRQAVNILSTSAPDRSPLHALIGRRANLPPTVSSLCVFAARQDGRDTLTGVTPRATCCHSSRPASRESLRQRQAPARRTPPKKPRKVSETLR